MTKKLPLIIILLLIGLANCGYEPIRHTQLPYKSISIKSVENRTLEPGLQDRFWKVFTEESVLRGVSVVRHGGDAQLSITFRDYKLNTISIKNDLSAEYRISLKADVRITAQGETVVEQRGMESEFLETFSASGGIQEIQARRDEATDKAIRSLSERILGLLLYTPRPKATN